VALRFVHRAGAVHAARHPSLWSGLPIGAESDIPDEQGQDRDEGRRAPDDDWHLIKDAGRVPSCQIATA
jgi:hypothetical protein